MKTKPIGSRPTNREELGSWYASILEEQARSGQSVTEFAAGVGISAWSLYEWRRRLSRAVNGREEQTARLVEVAVVQKERRQAGHLRVRLGRSGHRVDVPAGFNDAELRRLIGVLESC